MAQGRTLSYFEINVHIPSENVRKMAIILGENGNICNY